MRFSLRLNNDLSGAELTEIAVAAEAHGFDQLWVSNDLLLRSAPVLVATLAARTRTLGLGIAIMNPYSVHVAELAMMAATLQEVSGGRFHLGLGAGAKEFLAWVGIERPAPLAATATAISTLRAMLGHADVDRSLLPGWFGPQSLLKIPATTPVPVYLGGMGPRMLALSGRVADGALPLLYPPEHFAVAQAQVLTGLAAAGRDRCDFDLPACFWVSVGDVRSAGLDALAEKLAYYGRSISPELLGNAGLSPDDFAPATALAQQGLPSAHLVNDRMLSLGIAGNATDVIERCRVLISMGATHLSFGPPLGPDPLAAVEILGRDVVTELRRTPITPSAGKDAG